MVTSFIVLITCLLSISLVSAFLPDCSSPRPRHALNKKAFSATVAAPQTNTFTDENKCKNDILNAMDKTTGLSTTAAAVAKAHSSPRIAHEEEASLRLTEVPNLSSLAHDAQMVERTPASKDYCRKTGGYPNADVKMKLYQYIVASNLHYQHTLATKTAEKQAEWCQDREKLKIFGLI